MSVCRIESEHIRQTLSEIEGYLFMNEDFDLANEKSLADMEKEVTTNLRKDLSLTDFTEFKLMDYLDNFPDFKENVEALFEDYMIEVPTGMVGTPAMGLMKTNVSGKFSTGDINEMFHTLPMVKLGFDNYLNLKLAKATFLNDAKSKFFVTTDKDVTNNLNDLKEELFQDIQKFLIANKLLVENERLFTETGAIRDYKHYQMVMTKLENYFFKNKKFKLVNSYNNDRKVPNIEGEEAGNITEEIRKAYYNGLILNNFDTVVGSSGKVDVNYNQFGNIWSDSTEIKYRKTFEGLKTTYFKDGSHESEGVSNGETKLLQMIISAIPAYDKKGRKTEGALETKDFYLFGAKIADFELEHGLKLRKDALKNKAAAEAVKKGEEAVDTSNDFVFFNEEPKKAILWYINNIANLSGTTVDGMAEHFKYNTEFALSLKNFIESDEFNIQEKEKNSDESVIQVLSQVFNNSFGASYITYNSNGKYILRSAYNQNFNNTRVQDTVFNKMFNNFERNLYDKEKDKAKIQNLFNSLEGSKDVIKDLSKLGKLSRVAIARFLKYKTGININYLGVEEFITDLANKGDKNDKEALTHTGLVTEMNKFLESLSMDFDHIKESIDASDITKMSRGDDSASAYIKNTINSNAFKALSTAYLMNTTIKPIMTIQTLTGESIPTFKTANLTYKDTELVWEQYLRQESNNGVYRSLLTDNSEKMALLGTNTKLELVNGDVNKSAAKFNVAENFTGDFQFGFIQSLLKNDSFDVMIGNYSDKSTILTKTISALFKVLDGKEKVNVTELSSDKLLNLMRRQSENYYKDVLTKVINDYAKLLKIQVKTTKNEDIFKSIDKINAKLSTIPSIETLSPLASQLGIDFTKELHYSRYGDTVSMNQLIVDNFKIFSSFELDSKDNATYPLFNEFVKRQEDSFIDKFKYFNSSTGSDSIKLTANLEESDIELLFKKLGLKDSDFGVTDGGDVDIYSLVQNDKLNPILKKWMWLQSLYRNEYLFMTGKGEYMHPAKDLSNRSEDAELDMDSYMIESSERLKTMGKRNVMFTSTVEIPTRKTRFGVPEDINIAVVNDEKASLFNISGQTKNQDIHDGSSFINTLYSKMVDASFPGKGYKGTKKPFGTFITDYGVVIKKDAEFELTNDRIRNSKYSSIKLQNKQKQMLSIDVGNIEMDVQMDLDDKYYYKNGEHYRIDTLTIKNNRAVLDISKKQGETWFPAGSEIEDFNTLYKLWELFGGIYSTNENKNFNEGSNDLLYRVITTEDVNGNFPLKDKMIHVVSNSSSIKAGGVNINSMDSWKNGDYLSYSTFKNRFIGPQLDANHEANDSRIKEITQVISALAQNPNTAEIAQEAYEDIANIIEESVAPYLKYLEIPEGQEALDPKELYKYVSERFVKTISNTKGDNIAKVLVHSFKEDVNIPFSNQNFYVAFVRDIITKMNNEFITRYYSGMGAVLAPSHGIIQLYQSLNGTIRSQEDVISRALNQNYLKNPDVAGTMTNDEIIADYIQKAYAPRKVAWSDIEIGDTVLLRPTRRIDLNTVYASNSGMFKMAMESVQKQLGTVVEDKADLELAIESKIIRFLAFSILDSSGQAADLSHSETADAIKRMNLAKELLNGDYSTIDLKKFEDFNLNIDPKITTGNVLTGSLGYFAKKLETPIDYYRFKGDGDVYKDFRVPRDLKPSSLKYTLGNGETKNQYDLDSVRLLFKLNEVIKNGLTHESDPDVTLLQEFSEYIFNGYDSSKFYESIKDKNFVKQLRKYLGKWTNLSLNLMKDKRALVPIMDLRAQTEVSFADYFGLDVSPKGISMHNLNNIYDDLKDTIKHTEDILSYSLDKAEIVMGDIHQTKFGRELSDSMATIIEEKEHFFKDKLDKYYKEDDTEADIKIVTDKSPVYIKFVAKGQLPGADISLNIKANRNLSEKGVSVVYNRISDTGEILYRLPPNSRARKIDGKEFIFIESHNEVDGRILGYDTDFDSNINKLINSFKNVRAFVPLMKGELSDQIFKHEYKDKKTGKKIKTDTSLNRKTVALFKNHTGYNDSGVKDFSKNWFNNNKESILTQMGKKMYASWEQSREVIAARIPSQSMQSFMEMNLVSYLNTSSNDAYVSVWQIWLQGSDFDIDKAYILGSGFNNSGHMDIWTNVSEYSTAEQLKELTKFPLPKKIKTNLSNDENALDITNELTSFVEFVIDNSGINQDGTYRIPKEFSPEVLADMNSAIRKANKKLGVTFNDSVGDSYKEALSQSINAQLTENKKTPLRDHLLLVDDIMFNLADDYVKIINKHNSNRQYARTEHAINNSVVSRVKQIISDPTSQILANAPVDVQILHEAIKESEISRQKNSRILQPTDNIIWAHPGIGKTEFLKKSPDAFIDWDVLFNANRDNWIAKNSGTIKGTPEYKKARNEYLINYNEHDDFKAYVKRAWTKAKAKAKSEGKKLLASPHMLLKMFPEDFDKVITMTADVFVERNVRRGEGTEENSRLWKQGIDTTLGAFEAKEKIRTYDGYLADLLQDTRTILTKNPLDILSPHDMFSMYKQQHDASVGKADVGIAANGLKAFFALSSYYNDYYANKFEGDETAVRRSFKTFEKKFEFIGADGKSKVYSPGAISDVKINKRQKNILMTTLANPEFYNEEAALLLSSFTSAATDNAKELIMAQVNATEELASMHIYLMILGFNANQVVEIMTSDTMKAVIKQLNVNMLQPNSKKAMVSSILSDLASSVDKDSSDLVNIKTMIDIYQAAQELKTLAKFLGINQKVTANTEEIFNYLQTFDIAFLTREHTIFGQDVKKILEWEEFRDSRDPNQAKKALEGLEYAVNKILETNTVLDARKDREHVRETLIEASKVQLKDGTTKSLLAGKFDYRLYMSDENYKTAAIKYYNLIKNTFNILDVIDTVPHFKNMIKGLNTSHNVLMNTSAKYNAVHTTFRDTYRNSWHRLTMGEDSPIKNYMGNYSFGPIPKKTNINKFIIGFDMKLKSLWLQENDTNHLSFDVGNILAQVNALLPVDEQIKEFYMYNSDEAMTKNFEEAKKDSKLTTRVTSSGENADAVITLNTNHGIASFKRLMEQLLLPIIQDKSDILSESLRTRTVNNILGIKGNSLESSFPLSDISNPVSLAQSKSLLKAFNDLDAVNTKKHTIKNSFNKNLKWRDLFYVYNLLTNNERYGNLRLTPLFQDYVKEEGTLGNDFIHYASRLDRGEIKIFDLETTVLKHPEYSPEMSSIDLETLRNKVRREIENDVLFYGFNEKGGLGINTSRSEAKTITVNNPDFVVVTSVSESEIIKKKWADLHEIKRLIKNNGFIVKFEC